MVGRRTSHFIYKEENYEHTAVIRAGNHQAGKAGRDANDGH